jgi:hypothetical protein
MRGAFPRARRFLMPCQPGSRSGCRHLAAGAGAAPAAAAAAIPAGVPLNDVATGLRSRDMTTIQPPDRGATRPGAARPACLDDILIAQRLRPARFRSQRRRLPGAFAARSAARDCRPAGPHRPLVSSRARPLRGDG